MNRYSSDNSLLQPGQSAQRSRQQSTRERGEFEWRLRVGLVGAVSLFMMCNFGVALAHTKGDPASCEALGSLQIANGRVTSAKALQAPPGVDATAPLQLPPGAAPFCRVTATLTPTSDSRIGVEIWLPPPERWNGKFKGVGSGGLGGTIPYDELAAGVKRGYATAATDTGHDNRGGPGLFALGHPEKIIDYGHRAVHLTALVGKTVTSAYYGRSPVHAYFVGCSQGGQEAMMEAQRYPTDYDGIIAGDPDYHQTRHEVGAHLWMVSSLFASPESKLSPAKARLIGDAVNKACDALDGVEDGVLEDPRRCHFDPGVLQCLGADENDCLTQAQVEAVRKLWAGPAEAIHPGYYPGLERGGEATLWQNWIVADSPEKSYHGALGLPFFQYFVFENPNWDYRTFNYRIDPQRIDARFASALNATDPHLQPFQTRGGKLIHYHGFSDPDVPPRASIEYFESVAKTFRREHIHANIDTFYRLFMVPGMGHCSSGPGPNSFDMLTALEQWVEQGVAPETILATKYDGDDPNQGILRTRPLCPYPKIARYTGHGNVDDGRNFVCGLAPNSAE